MLVKGNRGATLANRERSDTVSRRMDWWFISFSENVQLWSLHTEANLCIFVFVWVGDIYRWMSAWEFRTNESKTHTTIEFTLFVHVCVYMRGQKGAQKPFVRFTPWKFVYMLKRNENNKSMYINLYVEVREIQNSTDIFKYRTNNNWSILSINLIQIFLFIQCRKKKCSQSIVLFFFFCNWKEIYFSFIFNTWA